MEKKNKNLNNDDSLKSIETPLGKVKIKSDIFEESMVDWVKDRLSKGNKKV